ncbi:S-layer homology domain-containing protein [Paenibacillus arenilitoris]|uniref:S-layer homology domain-containing protein n=1 Tax=Paenibacillus arenilitoris TaxID=2772299 RepID=A0A927H6I3_9BACL|nr:S-layer homology domain-containing protein [Paenibacillus arenilitoris]MBD2868594.1 S-layer homology domain-containing protein [Paenibacillus arenilitoris]
MIKHWRKSFAFLLTVSLIMISLMSPLGSSAVNGAGNAGTSERFPLASIPGWKGQTSGSIKAAARVDESVSAEGERSLYVTNGTAKSANTYYVIRQEMAVEPDTDYVVSAQAKGSNVGDNWFGLSGKSNRVYLPKGNYDWTQKSMTIRTNQDQHTADFVFYTESPTEELWIDDLTVIKAGDHVNLLQNAGFEQGEKPVHTSFEYAAPWTGSRSGSPDINVSVVDSVYDEGSRSLYVTNNTSKTAHTFYVIRQSLALEGDTEYTLSASVKGENVGDNWFGISGKGDRAYVPKGSYDWKSKSMTIRTNPGQTSADFVFYFEDFTADLWVDRLSVTKAGSTENLLQNAGFEEGEPPGSEPEPEPVGEAPVDINRLIESLGEKSYLPISEVAAITVDGDLGEWAAIPAISLPVNADKHLRLPGWNGENDLSLNAKFAYDDENLYANFVVKDQTHRGIADAAMWNGDSIQLGFSSDGVTYETEYGLTVLESETPNVWRWLSGSATLPASSVTLRAERDESAKETVYEAKFPWKAIFDEKPADDFRFTILLNDNDSSVRRGYVQWTDGIGMGKDATKMGTGRLVAEDAAWLSWLDKQEIFRSNELYKTTLDLMNFGDSDVNLQIESPELDLRREIAVPAGKAVRIALEKAFPVPGEHAVAVTVKNMETGESATHVNSFTVYESNDQLNSRFDAIASQLPQLDARLAEAAAKGITTDYETVNATVIRHFIQYGKDDVSHNLIDRAAYVANELERLYAESMTKLSGYLNGSLEPQPVPRYRTGTERIGIKDYGFEADKFDPSTGGTTRGPVIFTGYGHFDSARRDIPVFQNYGTNVIQVEIGPNSVIVPSEAWSAWSANKVNGVKANLTVDREVKRSGKGSLLIENKTPMAPNTFATVSQNVPVAPNTPYIIKAWVKGDQAGKVWFPGGRGWSKRQPVPAGTFDWTEVTVEYTTGANETSMPFLILSEDAGKVWFDDLTMTKAGDTENLLKFPGFDDDAPDESKGYVTSASKIENDILQVLERSKQHNIAVNLLLSPHYFPDWAKEKWPELDSNATEFIQFNFDHPKAREIIEDYLRTIIPLIKDYPSLHSITMTNEPVYATSEDRDYHTPKFRLYLRELYHNDIGKLNQVYGAGYASFDEVIMPTEYASTPEYYDWFIYNNQVFTGWHQWMADIIHDVAPNLPVQSKVMNGILGGDRWGVDFERMSELSQINGNDASSYLDNGKKDYIREFMFYDFQTSLKKAPVFNSEHHVIPDGDDYYGPEQAMHVNTQLWQSSIHGRSGSTVWVWDRTYDTSSVIAGSVMHRPDVAAIVGKTNLDLNRLVDEVSAFQNDDAEIAILYSLPAVLYNVRDDYPESVRKLYEAISLSGVKTGFITEKQLKEGKTGSYKAIVVPHMQYADGETLERLKAFGAAGGELVIVGDDSVVMDEHGQSLEGATRDAVFGMATVLEEALTTDQLKEWFMGTGLYDRLNEVVVFDEETNKPVADVEWRSVLHNGKWLLNLANYGSASRTVSISWNGKKVEQAVDLINGSLLEDGKLTLPQRLPVLLQWEIEDGPDSPGNPGNQGDTGNPPALDGRLSVAAGSAGTANLNNEAKVELPAGAMPGKYTISITKVEDEEALNEWTPKAGFVLASEVYEFLKDVPGKFRQAVTVTLTINPSLHEGKKLAIHYYDEAKKVWVELGGEVNGSRISVMTDHFTKFAVLASDGTEISFNDITGHWAAEAIKQAAASGIASGFPDGTFKPNRAVTRAEFSVMLSQALQTEENAEELRFADADAIPAWAKDAVAGLSKAEIIVGYSDNNFGANRPISRSEIAVMIVRAAKLSIDHAATTDFADDRDIPAWAKGAIAAAAREKLIQGRDGNLFAPNALATRAEAIALIMRLRNEFKAQ